MKYLLSALFALIFALPLSAQLGVDAKVNFGSLITGGLNVQADAVVHPRVSVAAGFGYAGNGLTIDGDRYRIRRVRFIPEVRFYLTEGRSYLGSDGPFIGAYGKVNRIKAERITDSDTQQTGAVRGAIGAFAGYKWVTGGGVVIELNSGIGGGTIFGGDLASNVAGKVIPPLDFRIGLLVGYRIGAN